MRTPSPGRYEVEKTIWFEKRTPSPVTQPHRTPSRKRFGHEAVYMNPKRRFGSKKKGDIKASIIVRQDTPQSLVRRVCGAEVFVIPCIHIGLPSFRRSFLFPAPVSTTSTFSSHSLARRLTSLVGLTTNGERKGSAWFGRNHRVRRVSFGQCRKL